MELHAWKGDIPMAARKPNGIAVTFVGLGAQEKPPATALYRMDAKGGPPEKVARVEEGSLGIDPEQLKGAHVALGPDVSDPKQLDLDRLLRFRLDQVIDDWRERGLLVPADRWRPFLRELVCVSGRVRKCRPWWYDLVSLDAASAVLTQRAATGKLGLQARTLPNAAVDLSVANILLPWHCLPLCDGIVEVYERHCCCSYIVWDDLIDRLRDILERIPVEIDWPVPPIPDPGPWAQRRMRQLPRPAAPDLTRTQVSERVFRDYQALLRTPRSEVEAFVRARPYLVSHICSCSMRKVGEVAVRPGGDFDFCYWRPIHIHAIHQYCYTTYAYRVKQLINGVWTVVYDGVAGHDYFAQGENADLRTSHPGARPCGDGPPPPDEGDGMPFVMLEHVTGAGTHHFNFPTQNGLSQVGPLDDDDGLYDFGSQVDCPWAQGLGLRLWFSPSLDGVVVFYRLKVVPVNGAGVPVGSPQTLDQPVAWQRYVTVGGNVVTTSTGLAAAPADVGSEVGLFRVPYWSNGMDWLSGQYHQSWNTTAFPDGKYMLILELFGPNGVRIKPSSAPPAQPGTARPFQLRRWTDPTTTANVPHADCAHVFWLNNRPVTGDIVDLRRNHNPSIDECQFMSGPSSTTVSVGFRAFHLDGVTTGGGASDTDSFMAGYSLTWQRGLNGPFGTIESGSVDKGEAGAAESNTMPFGTLLGPFWWLPPFPPAPPSPVPPPPPPGPPPTYAARTRCTFAVHLHVDAKHHNGGSFIDQYDYHETASFALEMT